MLKFVCSIVLLASLYAPPTSAQQRGGASVAQRSQPYRIAVGQSLDDTCAILKARSIEFGEGGFAFALGDPDRSNLHFQLDEDHTSVCVFFSKSKQVVTGISLVFFPSRREQSKTTRTWVAATEVLLHEDRSYSVRFSKPLTAEELRKREAAQPKSQIPRATVPNGQGSDY
jgi:hypothetical protein